MRRWEPNNVLHHVYYANTKQEERAFSGNNNLGWTGRIFSQGPVFSPGPFAGPDLSDALHNCTNEAESVVR